ASAPFLFFADFTGDLAGQVARGRAQFLSQFPSIATPEAQSRLRNPTDRSTFEACRLDLSERQKHAGWYALHRDLLRLRREDPTFRRQRFDLLDCAALGQDALVIRYFHEINQTDSGE